MLSKLFPRIQAKPLTERIQSRDAFVYLDRVQKLWGWRATEDERWMVLYNTWAFIWNVLLLVLLPLSMSMEYVQRFKNFSPGEFFGSLEICVDMYGCSLKCVYTMFGYKRFQAARKLLDRLDLRCTSDEDRASVHRSVALANRCYVTYHILYSGFVVINWTGYLLLGSHAWRMYLPGLDSEKNFLVTSFFELLLMSGVVTMNQCTDVSPLAHMIMARCHMGLLKDRLTKLHSDYSKTEKEHQEDLNRCIQDHSVILEYVNLLRPVYSVTIFVQFLLIGLVLGLSMIHIMFFSNFWTGIGTMCFMFDVCLETFPFCYLCNIIIEDCRELSESLFQSDWLGASRKYKSTLVYFLHNLQQPIILTAGGVFPICMQTNLSMVKLAFSVVTVIKQFNLAEKFQ
ncbi:GL14799 [Drosophila persimilis]|uniref:Odorant receptor n=1 Tax=Drosophila persimilis TaxID=7234 RepID=B4GQ38_DROPE|nr:odorant receptor 22a [Drosophila persimilis]EDW39710.1 GL14799 [Drosophila persimilis]